MSALTEAYVAVKPDTRDFGPQLKRQLGKVDADRAGRTVGGSFGKGFTLSTKKLLVAGAIFKGIQALGRSMSGIWGEGTEAIKAGAQTAAVIKSTGGAARVTAIDVETLSDAISRQTGRDDELITAGQNMLLTFTRVRNEQGKGNDIFTQATKVSSDLAVATGKDLVGANVLLGKALNDPTRGLTALTRVGVTFDEGQRKQIKSMQAHGNIAGAQKIILAELRKEFGGSAAAQATFGEKAKVAWNNVREGIGVGLIKSLNAVSPALEQIGSIATQTFKSFSSGVAGSKGVFRTFADFLSTHQGDIVHGFVEGGKAVLAFGEGLLRTASGGLRAIGTLDQGVGRFFSGFLDMTGEMIHGAALAFRWVPGIGPKLRKASEDFDAFSTVAKKGFAEQGKGAFAAADKLDGYADAAAATRKRLQDLGQTEVWKARQRDAANAARIAIEDIGTKADGSQIKLKSWNKRTELGSVAQRELEGRIKAARQRMIEQRETGIKAGATQGQLTKRWDQGKEALYREFKQMGLSNKAARDLTERYGRIPKKAETKVTQPGMPKARTDTKDLDKRINDLNNKTVTINFKSNAAKFAKAFSTGLSLNAGERGSTGTTGARGTVLPGWSPGRDIHRFVSPTGGTLDLSGGEAVMRPEWTKAVGGKPAVDRMNRAARTGKLGSQAFAGGGVYRDIITRTGPAPRLPNLEAISNRAAREMGAAIGRSFGKRLDAVAGAGGGPVAGGSYAAALRFARAQAGEPYRFAAVGPNAWDCSGFVGTVHNVILGKKNPYSRRYSSGSFRGGPKRMGGLTRNKMSAFRVGVIPTGENGGKIGHMAATLNGVNIESAGGVGVRIGGRARGVNSGLFHYKYGLARGGMVGDLPFDRLDPRGRLFDPWLARMLFADRGSELATGGIVRGGRGGVLAHIGEGANDELVTPLPKGWRGGQSDDKLDRLIAAIEAHGLNGPTLNFGDIHNPREEALSQTANKILQRVASLPLV